MGTEREVIEREVVERGVKIKIHVYKSNDEIVDGLLSMPNSFYCFNCF